MQKFFNIDGPVFVFLNKVANLVILNLLWLICCIPIFTIGASTTALIFSTMRILNHSDSHIIIVFFKTFKQYFKRSTLIELILLFVGAILGCDAYLFYNELVGTRIFFYISLPFILLYLFIVVYIFAVLTIYDNTVKNAFRNALFFSISHIFRTITMLAGIVVIFLISTQSLSFFASYGILFWGLIGFALIAYICSSFYNMIFKKDFSEIEYNDKFI